MKHFGVQNPDIVAQSKVDFLVEKAISESDARSWSRSWDADPNV